MNARHPELLFVHRAGDEQTMRDCLHVKRRAIFLTLSAAWRHEPTCRGLGQYRLRNYRRLYGGRLIGRFLFFEVRAFGRRPLSGRSIIAFLGNRYVGGRKRYWGN